MRNIFMCMYQVSSHGSRIGQKNPTPILIYKYKTAGEGKNVFWETYILYSILVQQNHHYFFQNSCGLMYQKTPTGDKQVNSDTPILNYLQHPSTASDAVPDVIMTCQTAHRCHAIKSQIHQGCGNGGKICDRDESNRVVCLNLRLMDGNQSHCCLSSDNLLEEEKQV